MIITIDGPAGVGKSTTARLLAKRLGLLYLDTGATYRTLAYATLERGIDPRQAERVAAMIPGLKLRLRQSAAGELSVWLDGQDVTRAIRSERVTEAAATIAQHPAVREAMVCLQRRLARGQSIVAEGRDTGSVVFPNATHKFFLTANPLIRAQRRRRELLQLHGKAPAFQTLVRQLTARDRLDRTRAIGPLIRPEGSIHVDTTKARAGRVVEQILDAVTGPSGARRQAYRGRG